MKNLTLDVQFCIDYRDYFLIRFQHRRMQKFRWNSKILAIENSQFTFVFQPKFCASINAQDIFDIRPLYCTDKDITYTLAVGFRFYGIENI